MRRSRQLGQDGPVWDNQHSSWRCSKWLLTLDLLSKGSSRDAGRGFKAGVLGIMEGLHTTYAGEIKLIARWVPVAPVALSTLPVTSCRTANV